MVNRHSATAEPPSWAAARTRVNSIDRSSRSGHAAQPRGLTFEFHVVDVQDVIPSTDLLNRSALWKSDATLLTHGYPSFPMGDVSRFSDRRRLQTFADRLTCGLLTRCHSSVNPSRSIRAMHRSRPSDPRCSQAFLLFPVCRHATAISSCRPQFRLNLYSVKMSALNQQPVGQDKISCMLLAADARQETSQDLCASMRTISHQTHVGDQALGDARGKPHTALRLHCAHALNPNPPRGERPSRCDPQQARF